MGSQKIRQSNRGRKGQRVRSNSDPEMRTLNHNALATANYGPLNRHEGAFSQNHSIFGDAVLCVEDSSGLPHPYRDTRASQEWQESSNCCTVHVEDYTQVAVDEKEEKDEKEINYNEVGSSHAPNVEKRTLVWKIPKPTNLETFFQIARKKLNITDNSDIRVFRTSEGERYLINFPHRFVLKNHNVLIERGRMPKFNEVFL